MGRAAVGLALGANCCVESSSAQETYAKYVSFARFAYAWHFISDSFAQILPYIIYGTVLRGLELDFKRGIRYNREVNKLRYI